MLVLSHELVLVYVLRPSGVVGRLVFGWVSRGESGALVVYDRYGKIIEYLSGPESRVRSWCLMNSTGEPVQDWCELRPEDREKVLARDSA